MFASFEYNSVEYRKNDEKIYTIVSVKKQSAYSMKKIWKAQMMRVFLKLECTAADTQSIANCVDTD